jgi:hypothetical protein
MREGEKKNCGGEWIRVFKVSFGQKKTFRKKKWLRFLSIIFYTFV